MSSIVRIICGLGLILFAWFVYDKNRAAIADGNAVTIAGFAPNASPSQIIIAFGVIGLIGAVILILGVIGLLKQKR